MQNRAAIILVLILVFSIPSTAMLPARGSSNREASENSIDWYSFEEGKEEAEKSDRPIFIYFMTDTCGFCQKMEDETFTDENVRDKTEEIIFIKVNAVERSDLVEQYGIRGVPSMFFETPKGEEIESHAGFMKSTELVEKLNRTISNEESSSSGIEWYSFEEGKAEAEKSDRPVFLYFKTYYCGVCQRMQNETFTDERVQNKTEEVIFIRVNATKRKDLVNQYDVEVVPTLIFENSEGEETERKTGFTSASELVENLSEKDSESNNESPLTFFEIILSLSASMVIFFFWTKVKKDTNQ